MKKLLSCPVMIALIGSLVLTACATPAPAVEAPAAVSATDVPTVIPATEAPVATAAPATEAPPEPQVGGNLVFGHMQLASSLDANVWTAGNAARIMGQIYDPLVWQPEGGKFVPGLAEKWEISADGKSYTFYLRKDVKFHDGTAFDAAAVKFTFDRIVDPASKSLQKGRLGPYGSSEVVDSHTVKVNLTEPYTPFMSALSETALSPASPTAVKALGDKFAKYPVATGPFRVKTWQDDNTLVLERNPDYAWGPSFLSNKGAAYLDTITYKFVPELSTRLVALESGEAQIIDDPPPEDVARLTESGIYNVETMVVPGMCEMMNINITRFPTNELAVRQAMQYGVDRQSLVDLIFFGTRPPGQSLLTSGSWAFSPEVAKLYPYDQNKARQVLEGDGWKLNPETKVYEKDGKPLLIRQVTTAGGFTQKAAEFVQASLREVGFDYQIETMLYEATVKRMADNDYEVARLWYALLDPHDAFFLAFHSSQITDGGRFNRTRVQDSKVDELIKKGANESNTSKRMEIYHELNTYTMEQAFVLPAWSSALIHAMANEVQGFKVNLLGRPYLVDVWLQQ